MSAALRSLFVGRRDCFCVQTNQGKYVKVDEPLTDEVLNAHLRGEITVGGYQLDSASTVKWLCFDFDPEHLDDTRGAVEKLMAVLFEEKLEADGVKRPRVWPPAVALEASRHPDPSYHIWVFFAIPTPAKVAQWLGYRVLELANLNPKQVEVFPKQSELTTDRPFGNFVKLPLGKHQVADKWSKIIDFETFEPLPINDLENKHGLSFSEEDMAKLEGMETKRSVQTAFELPKMFKPLSDKNEEEAIKFLCKYWVQGYRNEFEMYFLGLCLKRGVSHESAKRIISEVVSRTNDEERQARLDSVDYHFRNRLNVSLKGKSGIREILREVKRREHD